MSRFFFPAAMLVLFLICLAVILFGSSPEGVWIGCVVFAVLGIGNAIRNKLKFGVFFTEQAS